MRSALRFLSPLLLAAAFACSSGGGSPAAPAPNDQARVSIDNSSSIDMDIYVHLLSGQTSRLGFAPANQTTDFVLPSGLTSGSALLQLEARPVRRAAERVMSDPYTVKRGDHVSWKIPAQ